MTRVTLNGKAFQLSGNLPVIGAIAFNFVLVATDLSDMRLSDLARKRVIMNVFPSVDTLVCAKSVRRFNEIANELVNTKVLCISKDLPFTHDRFNKNEGIDNVTSLSEFRNNDFGQAYGVRIKDGPFRGLFARTVVALDERHRVIYTQLVPEIGQEPDYDAVMHAMKSTPVCTVSESTEYPPTESGVDEIPEKKSRKERDRLLDISDTCDGDRSGKS